MGITISRHGSSTASALPTPEQEAKAKANHDRMKVLADSPPIAIGSEKQIDWAKKISAQFLFHAHAWGFKAEEINLVFADLGKYAKFWIDNRNPSSNSGEGFTRVAVEILLANIREDHAALAKSHHELAKLTANQIARKLR
jgi:hypothetical protein